MKKLVLALFVLISIGLVPCHCGAASDVRFEEAGIIFSLPAAWDTERISYNKVPPKMNQDDPLYVGWRREAIINKHGKRIAAGMSMAVFNVGN